MKQLFIFLFVGLSIGYAQNDTCKALFARSFSIESINANPTKFQNNINTLTDCLALSDEEKNALLTSAIFTPIFMQVSSKSNATYGTLANKFKKVISTTSFKEIKENLSLINTLEKQNVSLNNWKETKLILEKLKTPNTKITQIEIFLKKHPNKNFTFKALAKEIEFSSQSNTSSDSTINIDALDKILVQPKTIDLQIFLKEADKKNKKLLLFFTGYACINCNKMAERTIANTEVLKLIQQSYHFVSLFLDDHKILSKEQWITSKRSGRILKTKGMLAGELQRVNFKSNVQPYFVILDNNGQKLKDIQFSNTKDFIKFLNNI